MSNSDSEVEGFMARRPPSSYGSMCSDDHMEGSEHDVLDEPPPSMVKLPAPTGIRIHRPDSPETGITSVTQGQRSSVHHEGVFINRNGRETFVESAAAEMEVEEDESFIMVEQSRAKRKIRTEPEPVQPPAPAIESGQNELSLQYIFMAMLQTLRTLKQMELMCFIRSLSELRKENLEFRQLEQEGELDVLGVVDRIHETRSPGEALHITVRTLHDINKPAFARTLENLCRKALVQYELGTNNYRRYYSLYEGTCRPGQQQFIGNVYVESPIFIETSPHLTQTSVGNLFQPLQEEGRPRLVVTTGAPAVGLTVTVQKFIMDWTNNKAEHDFQYVFALPGRDLHLVRNSEQTFLDFLASFYPETKHAEFLSQPDCSVLFVIDALELCRQALDFMNNVAVVDVTTPAPADALLTSLIRGDLLPHASVWIAAHRSAARKIPVRSIGRFTELKGFDDAQKDVYFSKRTKDPALGARVLKHVKDSPALYDACYLPLLCWIVAFIYERRFQNPDFTERTPVLTGFFAQYIIVQTNRKIEHYVGTGLDASRWSDSDKSFLMQMGELALNMLLEKRDVFSDHEVSHLKLDFNSVAYQGGISYELNSPAESERSFKFVHYSVQQFMAAVYVYVTFRTTGSNMLEASPKSKKDRPFIDLYRPAIERVLGAREGRLDLFLRFLLGLAAKGTELHLRGHLLPQYPPESKGIEEVFKYARKKIKENTVPERCANLQQSILELEEAMNDR
ncbi:NLR family CARD domain-containing protein 3 [Trichomycterus rosablanca]|uniref:NLR family CARD domain-containing protein 3 n=1 Tax=Trichomycterus rosablanca TaxID=2290929 RepID=UPI002F350D43